ncbi:Acylphosphatase-1 [Tribonema minus]|uniref:Acylphosphatase n=1 Tax=Tribonema minus TaxID=303371 RepID=A0A835YKY3_9STRA|nr:Acylphosphatase-1 [Tribonema minus]
MRSFDFEIFGKVQGVFFRKYTKETADQLGITGWCMNTAHGTVAGHTEGAQGAVEAFKTWLRTKGSPHSRIDKAEFTNEKDIGTAASRVFIIKR